MRFSVSSKVYNELAAPPCVKNRPILYSAWPPFAVCAMIFVYLGVLGSVLVFAGVIRIIAILIIKLLALSVALPLPQYADWLALAISEAGVIAILIFTAFAFYRFLRYARSISIDALVLGLGSILAAFALAWHGFD